jgi:hypothetical protein
MPTAETTPDRRDTATAVGATNKNDGRGLIAMSVMGEGSCVPVLN